MCDFLSAIVLKNGDVLHNLKIDSHEELIKLNNLRDNREGNFARVEFSPISNNYDKPKKYVFKIDESITLDWFNDSMKEKTISKLSSIIKRMIVTKNTPLLKDGVFILSDSVIVDEIRDCFIKAMCGSSKVVKMCGSSKVDYMHDSSKIVNMHDSSKVEHMWDSSKVGIMWDSSKVEHMYGSSKVDYMYGSSKVGIMWNSSKIGFMHDSSEIENPPIKAI